MRNCFDYCDEDLLNVADTSEDDRVLSSFLLLVVSITIRFSDGLLRGGGCVRLPSVCQLRSFSFIFGTSLHLL